MKLILKICLIVLICGITSCQSGIKFKLDEKFQSDCQNADSCSISFNSLTVFTFDTMYIFKPWVSLEEVDRVLGINYPYWDDIADRIIFKYGGKIVYHEDEFPYSDNTNKVIMYFNFDNDTIGYLKIANREANFKVFRTKSEKRVIYKLEKKSAPNRVDRPASKH
jgi:hypothetical protein